MEMVMKGNERNLCSTPQATGLCAGMRDGWAGLAIAATKRAPDKLQKPSRIRDSVI